MLERLPKTVIADLDDADTDDGAGGRPVMTVLRVVIQLVLMAGVLVGSTIAMNRLIAATPERGGRPDFTAALPVDAVITSLSDQSPVIALYGEVQAGRSLDLRPAVGGEVVSVDPGLVVGLAVEAGQTLFEIDRFDYETALAEAEANLAQQRAAIVENRARILSEREQLAASEEQLVFAEEDLQRAEALRANGTLTEKQVDDRRLVVSQRRQAVTQRRNNLAIEEARLEGQLATERRLVLGVERARRNLADTVVVAPFSGVVRAANVETGRIVAPNDVVVSMYDGETLDVAFTLTDAQYGRIATDADPLIGREVDVIWTIGNTAYDYRGVVQRIGADIASERGGVTVFARLLPDDQPVDLRPGAFVELRVPDRSYSNAARIPDTALYGASTVYVIAEGQLERRDIEVAGFDGSDVIVARGLDGGERVLTTRLASIEEGLTVSVPALDGDTPRRGNRPAGSGEDGAARSGQGQ